MNIDPKEIEMGTRIEHEHTKDDALARKIAMDHLGEDPHYYTRLKKAGLEETDVEECAPCGCGTDEPHNVGAPGVVSIVGVSSHSGPKGQMGVPGAQPQLTSSGLGKNGTPKPLASDKLSAPDAKKVGANKVATSKTPSMPGAPVSADPMEHFGTALVNLAEGGSQIKKK
jgi:hypothetical protein